MFVIPAGKLRFWMGGLPDLPILGDRRRKGSAPDAIVQRPDVRHFCFVHDNGLPIVPHGEPQALKWKFREVPAKRGLRELVPKLPWGTVLQRHHGDE